MTEAATSLRCPVCRAPFRAVVACPRCGADLGPLMHLAAGAWARRCRARAALAAGDPETAAGHARAAEAMHSTASGRRLVRLLRCLTTTADPDARPRFMMPPAGRAGT